MRESNYPAGASCDPSAPFNEPLRRPVPDEDDIWCEVQHAPGEKCGRYATRRCGCGGGCCAEAMVAVHYEWNGRRYDASVCCECARLNYMVPANSALAIRYLRDALGHEAKRLEPGSVEYVALIDSFERLFQAIFAERREAQEAILCCGKLMT